MSTTNLKNPKNKLNQNPARITENSLQVRQVMSIHKVFAPNGLKEIPPHFFSFDQKLWKETGGKNVEILLFVDLLWLGSLTCSGAYNEGTYPKNKEVWHTAVFYGNLHPETASEGTVPFLKWLVIPCWFLIWRSRAISSFFFDHHLVVNKERESAVHLKTTVTRRQKLNCWPMRFLFQGQLRFYVSGRQQRTNHISQVLKYLNGLEIEFLSGFSCRIWGISTSQGWGVLDDWPQSRDREHEPLVPLALSEEM